MQVQIPGYRIRKVLGKGGMATVYLAVQEIFEREVALKVMSPALAEDPSFGQRFMREARIVSQLVHPNIVTVFDVGVHENMYYLSMEYIPGPDLKQACKKLAILQKLAIVLDVARALEFAGSKGYVHRDIKPENIILRDSTGRAVLMDFGIARAAETEFSVTQTGAAMGTPHYMSPEQARGRTVDHRSDLYSLGVVMYFLLMEQVPFHADSAVAIGIKHLTEPVPALADYLKPFSPIVTRLMAKKPEHRYQNASELIVDLARLDSKKILKQYALKQKHPSLPSDENAAPEPTVIENVSTQIDKALTTDARERVSGLGSRADLILTLLQRQWRYLAAATLVGIVAVAATKASSMLQQRAIPVKVLAGQQQNSSPATPSPAALSPATLSPVTTERQAELVPSRLENDAAGADTPPSVASKPEAKSAPKSVSPSGSSKVMATDAAPAGTNREGFVDTVASKLANALDRLSPKQRRLIAEVEQLRGQAEADPNNTELNRKLDRLAKSQFDAVGKLLDQGNHKRAAEEVEFLRKVLPDYKPELEGLQLRVQQRERLESFTQKAKQRLQQRQFFSPDNDSAEYYCMEMLMMAPEMVVAQQILVEMAQLAIADADQSLSQGDWQAAQVVVTRLLAIDPNHQASLDLQKKIRAYRKREGAKPDGAKPEVAKSEGAKPEESKATVQKSNQATEGSTQKEGFEVIRLMVSANPLNDIPDQQEATLAAQKALYAGFVYQAFPAKNTLVNAILYGPGGQARANVPITIDRTQGKAFFQIDHRKLFTNGEYELKIVFSGRTLQTTRFRIR